MTTLAIEKLVYGGDGLARLPADANGRRMAVFVPLTLPGELVETGPLQIRKGMARAELLRVVEASTERVVAPCPYFGRCGGCQLQHGSYELQIAAKLAVLRETMQRARVAIPDVIATLTGEPFGYRNRIRLHVRTNPWAAGYLERRSNRLLPVGECPIAAPLLQRAISALATSGIAALAPAGLGEIELFCSSEASQMTAAGYFMEAGPERIAAFAAWIAAIQQSLPELRGAIAFHARAGERSEQMTCIGDPGLHYVVNEFTYEVDAGSFFQVNRSLLPALVGAAVGAVADRSNARVLDAYAGAGLFSVPLARAGAEVTAVEIAPASVDALRRNLRDWPQARVVQAATSDFLARAAPSREQWDAVLVDPPRAGLGPEVTHALARVAAPRLVYLSCDPTTLARDMVPLLAAGYAVETMTMVDLFPQTFHQETLVVLRHR